MSDHAKTIARAFHEAYERLAPSFGYETRGASAVPWDDVPEANKSLMIAVAGEVLAEHAAEVERLRLIALTDGGSSSAVLQLIRERDEAKRLLEQARADAESWRLRYEAQTEHAAALGRDVTEARAENERLRRDLRAEQRTVSDVADDLSKARAEIELLRQMLGEKIQRVASAGMMLAAAQEGTAGANTTEGGELPAEKPESREGIVTVYHWDGSYLGCMGIETWRAMLRQGPVVNVWPPASFTPDITHGSGTEPPQETDDRPNEPCGGCGDRGRSPMCGYCGRRQEINA